MSSKETINESAQTTEAAEQPKALTLKTVTHYPVGIPRSVMSLTSDEFSVLSRLAELLESSSLAVNKDGSRKLSKGDILLVIFKGLEVGFEPLAAIESINIIAGKPTIDPAGMLALINNRNVLEDMQIIEKSAEKSVIMMKRVGRSPLIHEFSMDDARMMKTKQYGNEIALSEKDNYKQQPAVMLQWRNVAAMCRLLFSDVLKGLKYTPEEMGADVEVDEGGNMIVLDRSQVRHNSPAPKSETSPAPTASPVSQSTPPPTPNQAKTAGETWLKTTKAQAELKSLLSALGYKAEDQGKWLSQIHPGLKLNKFGETTLTKEQLFNRLKVIAPTINPATPKSQPTSPPTPGETPQSLGANLPNPVIVDFVRYIEAGNQKHLQFETDAGDYIRAYGRSTTFKKWVGDDYYESNGFADMEPNTEETYEIDSLEITWESKTTSGDRVYLVAKSCKPLIPDAEETGGSELDDFLNDGDYVFDQAETEGAV